MVEYMMIGVKSIYSRVPSIVYLLRGKSARETGMALHLSQRTVEFYLDSLRDRLNCIKKLELIEKFYNLL